MSAESTVRTRPSEPITLDDLRHKALALREEVKDETTRVVHERRTQMIVGAVVLVALSVGVAYYLGTRAARAAAALPE
jgi:hypothetical protein